METVLKNDNEGFITPKSKAAKQSKMSICYPLSMDNVSCWMDHWEKEKDKSKQLEAPSDSIKQKWRREQTALSKRLILKNDFDFNWTKGDPKCIKFIGGVDVSFVKDSKIDACASIIICAFPAMNVVWECYSMIKLTLPYIPGLLAFREVPFIEEMLRKLKIEAPQYYPQLLMIDGNGILHMRDFGQACHLGLLADIPCFGVAKRLLYCDGITDEYVEEVFRSNRSNDRNVALLIGESGIERAYAFKNCHKKGVQILYISPGHRIDLDSCLAITKLTMMGNALPEPVHQADYLSREFLRLNY